MTRCMNCNGILTRGETECFGCGTRAPRAKSRPMFGDRFAVVIKAAFFSSLILTAVSFFTDRTPPFSHCLVASVILLFIMSSANQMKEKR